MSRKKANEMVAGSFEAGAMDDVANGDVQPAKKKRTVRYWSVKLLEDGSIGNVVSEYKSRARAEAFIDAARLIGLPPGQRLAVLKGKLLEV